MNLEVSMNEHTVKKIINETVFTMWVEGFVLPDEEKATLRKVLLGEIPFAVQLERYIQSAKLVGETTHV
jgi:hypothetical protein